MRKLVITLFCIALLIPSRGNTLGLGEIELHSSLNQELKAEIALLSVGKESAETIIVKLASREEFARAGIDRPFILNDLNFTIKVKNGQPYISVTSKKTIREPFLSFLLDIDWPRGRILREFTMLLDPPVFMQATPEGLPSKSVVAPRVTNQVNELNQQYGRPGEDGATTVNSQAMADAPVVNAQTPQAMQRQVPVQSNQVNTRPVARYQVQANGYRVQKGDTAWKIAEQLRTDPSISIEQMMMALLRRNPEAFIQDNINGVKRGYILRMPDQQEINNLSKQTALTQVREQYALWREYSQGVTAKRNANKIARDGGTVPESVKAAKGHLTIASAAKDDASEGATSGLQNPDAELKQLRQDLSSTSEELASGKLENEELKDRIKSLQTRMKKMERLLNLKDGDLANLQSDLTPESGEQISDTVVNDEPVGDVTPAAVDMKAEDSMANEPVSPTEDAAATPLATEPDVAMDAVSSTQPAEGAVFKDEVSSAGPAATPPVVIPPAKPVVVGESSTTDLIDDLLKDPAGFIEDLLKDPANLPILAGVPAVIVILLLLIAIRRKRAKQSEEVLTELPETGDFNFDEVADIDLSDDDGFGDFDEKKDEDLEQELEAFAAETDADEEDVISLDDDQPAEEDGPKDDVLAEADVYLAYGIYQQAEELLKTAITTNPDRNEYKVKLLETYFAAKDKGSFLPLAEQVKASLKPQSAEWQRIISMGRELDATNEMFRDAGDMKDFDVDDLALNKPETDFDLGDAAADFELGDSIDDDFTHGLDDDSLDDDFEATAVISAADMNGLNLGDSSVADDDNFALDDDGLDELDLELAAAGFESEEKPAQNQNDEEDESEDSFSLDFEMADLGLDELNAEVSAEETEKVASSMTVETDDSGFNLSDDEDDLGDALESLDMDDSALEMNDVSSGDTELASEEDFSLDMADLDTESLDLSADDEEDISLDMGDIDLSADFDDPLSEDEGFDLGAVDLSAEDESIDINSLPDDLDEVNTKLDLARAYMDMGDGEGAASILREVIEEGADQQKQVAEELLKNIA
ncbi:MAG: hypothetical protein OEY29_09325 [Gammaproteobacteria bacterium]|nr:hypothetical protein [Gammaproteobacteria bacterium]